MTRRGLAVCVVLVLAIPCFGGNDHEFDSLVKAVEAQDAGSR